MEKEGEEWYLYSTLGVEWKWKLRREKGGGCSVEIGQALFGNLGEGMSPMLDSSLRV